MALRTLARLGTVGGKFLAAVNGANNRTTMVRWASTYKAAMLKGFGEPLVVTEVKQKKLKEGEVRVAVHSCGVNSSDLLMVENKYDRDMKLPFVPGFEICGEVLEVGSGVSTLTPGLRVIGVNKEGLGGFAEECVLPEMDVWPVDLAVSFNQGAALVDCYATALLGLNRRAGLKEGQTVLITAAAGGLGLAAVDLACSVYKAKVIGICGTEDKADLVRQKGAWAALKYNKKHLMNKVNEVTDGRGVDVIFDAVGGDIFSETLQCIAHEGSVIVAGFASRIIPHIETNQLLPKAVSLIGLSLFHYRDADNEVYRQAVEDVIDLHEMNLISPHISASFSLEESSKAFDFIKERKSTGKVILEIR
ncbi:quinone oxidoreductase-like protein 2 homolog [Oratosquilla oratoria]|uniref:quinone oxidoreductase-like protein 2 homolog n=1 Tax=Oratosquilla oratoria TaxID=337810 RepID=UPI003F75D781